MEWSRRHAMSCPYLTEVTMAFCAAFPVKKLVPTRNVVTESACDGERFGACPVFRELQARCGEAACPAQPQSHTDTTKEGGGS
jgi:hypothetical protein